MQHQGAEWSHNYLSLAISQLFVTWIRDHSKFCFVFVLYFARTKTVNHRTWCKNVFFTLPFQPLARSRNNWEKHVYLFRWPSVSRSLRKNYRCITKNNSMWVFIQNIGLWQRCLLMLSFMEVDLCYHSRISERHGQSIIDVYLLSWFWKGKKVSSFLWCRFIVFTCLTFKYSY